MHGALLVQAMHAPALHTMPVPQTVPLGALPVSTHVAWPVAQEIEPVLHTEEPPHAAPASPAQVNRHCVPSHVGAAPGGAVHGVHDDPQVATDVLLTHVPLHSCVPIGQPHAPAAQVLPLPAAPHGVPSATLACGSTHADAPVVQLVSPR